VTQEAPPAKILIVEDEALIAREIMHRLTNMGWDVVGTAFGEEAVELAIETQPDLLLSDINLRHGLSGIDLAQRIQAVVDIPVVFLTAYSDEDTVARAKTVTPFGYIIKPVENRDLQITIEMALYKFRVEKELREKQQLLQTAFACIGSSLIFIGNAGRVSNINADAEKLLGKDVKVGSDWKTILGDTRLIRGVIERALTDKNVVKVPPFLLHRRGELSKLVDGIVGPMDEGAVLILRDLGDIEDPVRLEPAEQYATLGEDHLSPSESAFCQLLIAPDNVAGRDIAEVVEQVRVRLDTSLRSTDLASVFAGSVVSISLPYTDLEEGQPIGESLRRRLQGFEINGQVVTFSAGLAHSSGGDQEPIELFRRAASALDTARRSGGDRLWVNSGEDSFDAIDIQGGSDYRHVILLWNVMSALANAGDLDAMCEEFCRHLFHVFAVDRSAMLTMDDGRLNLEVAHVHDKGQTDHISDLHLSEREFAAIRAVAGNLLHDQLLTRTVIYNIADRWVLLLSGVEFSEEDQRFLETLCAYFASSIPRFDVAAETSAGSDTSEQALVYDSVEMREVLEAADLAAPTDATVLLTGESGTGKELVARYIHERGNRAAKSLIVVDCGAVAPSLIESELFGHVKGAFTGATSNFNGRLKEAEGGTVLLDEVGELPLDTQVKLLRFVQERQLAPVGSNQYERVDARVIAATNKDLMEMVAAGTFREDLFYRLNVFSVSVPPLRDRRDDILKIARHYLDLFARRYSKELSGFTEEAEQVLLQHHWPGNIRELSNVVNRAVILSKDNMIWPIHLGVFGAAVEAPAATFQAESDWRQLIRAVIDVGLKDRRTLPVGRYLEEDFILLSISRHDGVLNRAAMTIGVPESTLRRKIQKVEETYGSIDPERPEDWPVNPGLYDEVLQMSATRANTPLEQITLLLLEEIEAREINKTTGARLLGVSLPTYRRLAS
jgi:DNA-binding NtrC family response regulator